MNSRSNLDGSESGNPIFSVGVSEQSYYKQENLLLTTIACKQIWLDSNVSNTPTLNMFTVVTPIIASDYIIDLSFKHWIQPRSHQSFLLQLVSFLFWLSMSDTFFFPICLTPLWLISTEVQSWVWWSEPRSVSPPAQHSGWWTNTVP